MPQYTDVVEGHEPSKDPRKELMQVLQQLTVLRGRQVKIENLSAMTNIKLLQSA